MIIYGVSQSIGVERRLGLEKVETGVSVSILEKADDTVRERIVVPTDDLMMAVVERLDGGTEIEGQAAGKSMRLEVKVRRNEVLLKTSAEGSVEWDVAVGLDDFQDALEGVVG